MTIKMNEKVKLVTVKVKGSGELTIFCFPNDGYVSSGDIVMSDSGIEAVVISYEEYVDHERLVNVLAELGEDSMPCIVTKYTKHEVDWKED